MIIQNNDTYSIGNVTGSYDKLPIGTYRLRFNEMTGKFYLLKIEDFKLPSKLYGDFSVCNKILHTFDNTTKNLGILLTGEKGSGKTITAKKVCLSANKPIIVVDERFEEVELINFLADSSIGSCVVLIDEYEKLYGDCDSTIILQLLDGASNSHHLFILTCNQTSNISSYLLNRPSRIYYRKEYGSIPDDIIAEIIDCELINKEFTKEFYEVLNKFSVITYDIIMSLLREVNLYNESPVECAKLMNFVPEKIYIETLQIFEDGTNIDATYDSYLYPYASTLEVKNYKSAHSDDYSYKYINIDDFVRINHDTWEYKKDGLYYIINRKIFKSLLF